MVSIYVCILHNLSIFCNLALPRTIINVRLIYAGIIISPQFPLFIIFENYTITKSRDTLFAREQTRSCVKHPKTFVHRLQKDPT